tara:strand:+ start:80 stop:271 length:192 start_codon:yes stop_codon:yes gene_type:complete
MIYLYITVYVFILLLGLSAIITEKEIKGEITRSPVEYIFALHFGFVGLLAIAVYYLFTGRFVD